MEIQCPTCGLYQDDGAPTCSHMLGRKGGLLVVAKRGRDYYRDIGRQGSRVTAAKPGAKERRQAAGLKGGEATAVRGREYYRELGRRGGAVQRRRAAFERCEDLLGCDDLLGEETDDGAKRDTQGA